MSLPSDTSQAAADRRRRLIWSVAGGIAGLAVAVLVGWWTFRTEGQRITATTVASQVVDDTTVTVRFEVSRPVGLPVTCTVRALDIRFGVVGSADVVIPTGGDRVVPATKTFRTTSRAVTALVQDCVRTAPGP